MYYNSNKRADDYYNAYKQEMEAIEEYNKQGKIHQIIKIILISIALILSVISAIYLYKYFYPNVKLNNPQTLMASQTLTKEELPISPQIVAKKRKEKTSPLNATKIERIEEELAITTPPEDTHLTKEDIALIINLVISKLDKKNQTLVEQLNKAEKEVVTIEDLNKSNHYNKVVLTPYSYEENQTTQLSNLNNQLEHIISEDTLAPQEENLYTRDIQKEIAVRTNEMRIIVVKEGDTLSKIAKKAYGDPMAYPKIFLANPEIINNPNKIFAGQKLRIPS